MDFPRDHQAIWCPHCRGKCQFDYPPKSMVDYHRQFPGPNKARVGRVDVAYCVNCGGPLIGLLFRELPDIVLETGVVYPIASVRPPAPTEVREADADLAQDYKEAIAVEPHSKQAAAFLLGRCTSHVLITKCGAKRKQTLGKQIQDAKLPDDIAEVIDVLKRSRDQSAHPWFNEEGEHIRVDAGIVDWCFGIMDMVFEYFYVAPKRREKHQAKMDQMFAAKKAGEEQQ